MKTIFYTGLHNPGFDLPEDWTFHHIPTITIEYPEISADLLPDWISEQHYLVFLSRNGICGFEKIAANYPFGQAEIWCVGEKTAAEFEQSFHTQSKTPLPESALGLIEAFKHLEKHPVHLITAEEPRREFMDWLTESGWVWQRTTVYRTVFKMDVRWKSLTGGTGDYLVFTSPSTVKGYVLNDAQPNFNFEAMSVIAIGSTTASAIQELLDLIPQTAPQPHVEEILNGIIHGDYDK